MEVEILTRSKDPARNLPDEVFNIMLQHLGTYPESRELKTACLVSPQWYEIVSNSERFKDNRESCQFEIATEESKFNSLVDVNPSKFKKMVVTCPIAEHRYSNGSKILQAEMIFHNDHIKQMIKFNEFLTNLSFDDLNLEKTTLKKFIEFIASCHKLKHLSLDMIRNEAQFSCSTVASVKLPDLEYFHVRWSDWILEHLKCDKVDDLTIESVSDVERDRYYDNSIIYFYADPSIIVKFMNSIVQLNNLKLNDVDLGETREILSPRFKWKKMELRFDNIGYYYEYTYYTWVENWRMLLKASQTDAELIANFFWGSPRFGEFLNILSESAGLTKLEVYIQHPEKFKVDEYDENKVVRSVKYLKANFGNFNIFQRFSPDKWKTFNEKFFRLFPNAETLDLVDSFDVRLDMSADIFKNVKNLRITRVPEEFKDYWMPKLQHFEFDGSLHDSRPLEKFLENQINLKSFTAKELNNMTSLERENVRVRLQNLLPNVEITIDDH